MRRLLALSVAVGLTACASKPEAAVVAVAAPPPVPVAHVRPAGAVDGMAIPARLPDGSWPTPGRALSGDAAAWHLRAALNVAALACRDETLVTSYNSMLTTRRAALAAVEARYAAGWRAGGMADWQDRYDGQMTRAYNFYGQSFARTGFCAAATQAIAELAMVPDDVLPIVAAQQLQAIERPFADFFTAYAAWRGEPQPVMALVAPVPVAPAAPARPVLAVDPRIFTMP